MDIVRELKHSVATNQTWSNIEVSVFNVAHV